jgi:hypothetical protein
VPYCDKCGFQLNLETRFCPNCGAQLKPQRELLEKPAASDKAPLLTSWGSFTNGLGVGLGVATILGGLAVSYFLNMSFWTLHDNLTGEGLIPQNIDYLTINIRMLISGAAAFSVLGLFVIVLGVVYQLSSTARTVIGSKRWRARLGNGFISGGVVGIVMSVENLVSNIYSLYPFGDQVFTGFGVGGIFLILIGILLIMTTRNK